MGHHFAGIQRQHRRAVCQQQQTFDPNRRSYGFYAVLQRKRIGTCRMCSWPMLIGSRVIRGPGAIIWGANAMNGVINIITKKAADTQGGLAQAGGGLGRTRLRQCAHWGETPATT